jgi:hypothetical protein
MLIKNMMSQLKLKYQMIKGNEGPKDYSRQLTISSEDLIMAETWQRAQVFENHRLTLKVVTALKEYRDK